MPWPLLPWALGAAATALGMTGVKKGFDAKENYERAKEVGEKSEIKYKYAVNQLDLKRKHVNNDLHEFGRLKLDVFTNQIKHLIDAIKKSKDAESTLYNYDVQISAEELASIQQSVIKSLEIKQGLTSGAATGVLAGMGSYGAVGYFATASTGTAISSLSGAALSNATLAWLGGGSIASGGLGIAGGTAILGGLIAGPALAVGGFWMASKAEEALTDALAYSAKVDVAVYEFKQAETNLTAHQLNIKELSMTILEMVKRFDAVKVDDNKNIDNFHRMLAIGVALKNLLDIPVMDKDGIPIRGISAKISGYLNIT